ncbi:MAG: DUF1015 domain-containing protein, partial [Propionibacteriaceae bacterium]|nr:DUF1015 domain-containing protein [Propionibacteriaceae bacterium]
EPGTLLGSVEADDAVHSVERISDPDRLHAIKDIIAADDVLLADGHHRYSVARAYRDEVRAATGRTNTRAERTLAFVNELVEDQLCIEAIHRLYTGISADSLREYLNRFFEFSPATSSPTILADMVARKRLVILWPDGACEWLMPRCGVFDNVRGLDGVWLEMALENSGAEVTYQHGLTEMKNRVKTEDFTAGILIRPTTIEEIQRTAREGLLMPPKSTFFTPKLLTGWVLRASEPLPRRK